MSSYNLDFAPDTFYSATARNPLPVRVAGAIAAHHGYPILNSCIPPKSVYPTPTIYQSSPKPPYTAYIRSIVLPFAFRPAVAAQSVVWFPWGSSDDGHVVAQRSLPTCPTQFRGGHPVPPPAPRFPTIQPYLAPWRRYHWAPAANGRTPSTSTQRCLLTKRTRVPRSNSTAFAMDPDVKPRSSRNRRGSKHIGPCLPGGPADHIRVPQEAYQEPVSITGYQKIDYHRMQPIPFKTERSATPGISMVTVGGEYYPGLEDANAHVFENVVGYREIRVKLLWPGYPMYEKRFKAQADRGMVLMLVANVISNAFRDIISKRIPAKRGFEAWSIGKRPDGSDGIQPNEVIITGLEHRGGAVFQPEVWVPKRRMGIQ
ncbi:hypothetical protein C8J57DRAFT_1671413 [Mycena rebaudengoi]|nr:hypothetical protein C8J57DRAFT_1671413 [Mycena rebaudengoi]